MDNLVKKTADLKVDARKTRSGRIFDPQVGNTLPMAHIFILSYWLDFYHIFCQYNHWNFVNSFKIQYVTLMTVSYNPSKEKM